MTTQGITSRGCAPTRKEDPMIRGATHASRGAASRHIKTSVGGSIRKAHRPPVNVNSTSGVGILDSRSLGPTPVTSRPTSSHTTNGNIASPYSAFAVI